MSAPACIHELPELCITLHDALASHDEVTAAQTRVLIVRRINMVIECALRETGEHDPLHGKCADGSRFIAS